MTRGWVDIVVDGRPAQVRICYTAAWNDPDWRRVNGLPEELRLRKRPKHAPTPPTDPERGA